MKTLLLSVVVSSSAWASNLVCYTRDQALYLKKGSDSFYAVYECNKTLTSCSQPAIFEALGFEEEGSFSLHGSRVAGGRIELALVRAKSGWTASLKASPTRRLMAVMNCETAKR